MSILWHISRPGPRLLLPRCSRLRIKDGRLSPAGCCQLGGGSRVLIGAIDHRPSTEQSGAVHRCQTSLIIFDTTLLQILYSATKTQHVPLVVHMPIQRAAHKYALWEPFFLSKSLISPLLKYWYYYLIAVDGCQFAPGGCGGVVACGSILSWTGPETSWCLGTLTLPQTQVQQSSDRGHETGDQCCRRSIGFTTGFH